MNDGCVLIENFILAPDVLAGEEFEGPDLKSAALMRDDYLSFVADNFDLIADENQNVHMKYGTWIKKSMYGKNYMGTARWTFLIDEKGNIENIIQKVKTKKHTSQIL